MVRRRLGHAIEPALCDARLGHDRETGGVMANRQCDRGGRLVATALIGQVNAVIFDWLDTVAEAARG